MIASAFTPVVPVSGVTHDERGYYISGSTAKHATQQANLSPDTGQTFFNAIDTQENVMVIFAFITFVPVSSVTHNERIYFAGGTTTGHIVRQADPSTDAGRPYSTIYAATIRRQQSYPLDRQIFHRTQRLRAAAILTIAFVRTVAGRHGHCSLLNRDALVHLH